MRLPQRGGRSCGLRCGAVAREVGLQRLLSPVASSRLRSSLRKAAIKERDEHRAHWSVPPPRIARRRLRGCVQAKPASLGFIGKDPAADFHELQGSQGGEISTLLIAPASNIAEFVRRGTCMKPPASSSFYVAVTRAEQSVAIVLDEPGASMLPYWTQPAQQRL